MRVISEEKNASSEWQAPMLTGSEILVEALRKEQVEVIFGYPGGAVLPLYDALYDCGIRHVLARHEQGAIHAAEGYARVTGKPGVVIATSGPGATNLVTGLADAMLDSLPIVAITGQVARSVIGSDAFQETSIIGISTPITKHNYQVQHASELPSVLKEAFHIANTGRKGPVLVDIPKDVAGEKALFIYEDAPQLPGYQPTVVPHAMQIRKVLGLLEAAKRPVILAGAGVLHAGASGELRQFAERFGIPVVHTLLGLGGFPAEHPLFLGMGGMHGSKAANTALYETDLLLNFGARFDDRLTGNLKHFAPAATVVHVDIDPAEIGKNVPTDVPVVGDAKEALAMLLAAQAAAPDIASWREQLLDIKAQTPFWFVQEGSLIKPQRLISEIARLTKGQSTIVTDVGQHQMWAAQFYPFAEPNHWVTSGGLGTMGFGLPAAIGAQIAEPTRQVVAIVGDAGFQMTLQELAVVAELALPLKIVVVNNGALGMVRQWQELFYQERYSSSLLQWQPDFMKLAAAYDIPAVQIREDDELPAKLEAFLAAPGPGLLECLVAPMENVYPMIAPGDGLHQMVGVKP
ncbi:biosynthetic-type acetolactate synthase large subunit [Alicyclobacillus acidoterrestris]|uniref:Acetolactate synthase n=2 Tax=Alicyclobacillus acidoterrestris TaxID=1450 RepID=T0D5T0_ALIAG|nr:biosynthetic-type acetolactate synthase large subunit [Alicyclobacillus acidoterrestris]EPZ45071.1 acetolactate synthase [Alicyclobacillus acidoterrestris ATCC 49025]UNO48360.1 biosynthetic-type acetolactate synthase large subunit [Alicyclobacillus acidoterrestris]